MRKLVIGALVGVLTLAVTAIAVAATGTSGTTVQNYDQTFSAKKPKKSTGTTFSTSSIDEQNTAKNKQPKRVTDFDITFPAGTKIDSKAAPQCRATDDQLNNAESPDDACPRGSKIGSGVVGARLPYNGTPELAGTVTAYNAPKGLILYVLVASGSTNQTLILRPKFRGRRLLTSVPLTCVPPNRPDQGCRPGGAGEPQEVVLTNFRLKTNPKSTGRGKKRRNMITTPSKCPRGGWTFAAKISYADGTSQTIRTKSACRK